MLLHHFAERFQLLHRLGGIFFRTVFLEIHHWNYVLLTCTYVALKVVELRLGIATVVEEMIASRKDAFLASVLQIVFVV